LREFESRDSCLAERMYGGLRTASSYGATQLQPDYDDDDDDDDELSITFNRPPSVQQQDAACGSGECEHDEHQTTDRSTEHSGVSTGVRF
jgi:hypothetical protein